MLVGTGSYFSWTGYEGTFEEVTFNLSTKWRKSQSGEGLREDGISRKYSFVFADQFHTIANKIKSINKDKENKINKQLHKI
jgi:hypothetical protein